MSDALILRPANERHRSRKAGLDAVVAATGAADARRRVQVTETADFRKIAEMEADRKFNDRTAGDDANRLPQGFLTRAAHIKVMSPGTCRARSGQPLQKPTGIGQVLVDRRTLAEPAQDPSGGRAIVSDLPAGAR